MIGTFDYAAPEQLKEGPIDARTDVYALGGVLYQALTGKVPYPRETAAATMLAHLDSPPPSVLSRAARREPSCSARSCAARWPRTRATATRRRATSAARRWPPPQDRSRHDRGAQRRHRRRLAGLDPAREPPIPLPPALAVETGRGPFVGREALLATLARPLRRRRGRPAPVRPARRASPGSARRGWRPSSRAAPTARARPSSTAASDPESLVPYQPFIAALDHYVAHREHLGCRAELALELTELARFVPGLRRHVPELREPLAEEPETRRYRLFEGVTRMLAFAARERPVVLLLDDLHWADASTHAAARPPARRTRRRCGCSCSAPRARFEGELLSRAAPPAVLRADRR